MECLLEAVSELGDSSPDNINLTISREIELAKGDYIDIELRMVTFHDPSGLHLLPYIGITVYESAEEVQELTFDFNIPFATRKMFYLKILIAGKYFYANTR